jgi:hypothetical protein
MIKKIALGLASLVSLAIPSAQPTNARNSDNANTNECVRWIWSGDVYARKVTCVEWRKKDCSNRLYKEICKRE